MLLPPQKQDYDPYEPTAELTAKKQAKKLENIFAGKSPMKQHWEAAQNPETEPAQLSGKHVKTIAENNKYNIRSCVS